MSIFLLLSEGLKSSLVGGQLATDSTGLLGPQVKRHVPRKEMVRIGQMVQSQRYRSVKITWGKTQARQCQLR